jgi:glycosyltransferase involved in cell wall biosynthesis
MNKKVKILRLITRLNNGGPAKQAIWLTAKLKGSLFESLLVTGETEENEDDIQFFADEYEVIPVRMKNLKRSLNPLYDFFSLFSFYRILNREKPDVLHTHMSKAGFIGRISAILYNMLHKKKIIMVHTFHGHVFHSYFSRLKTSFFIHLERFLAKRTFILVTISQRLRDEILGFLELKKNDHFRIIPLGIDFEPSKTEKADQGSLNEVRIGMLGRLAPIKNYALAVEIAQYLEEDHVSARIIVGGGGNPADKENFRNLGNENISFPGNIENPVDFWKDIDIALITSKNEGTPVSLLEAMFSGIPFISSHVGGIPDMAMGSFERDGNLMIYKNCILVQGFNPIDFVKAIQYYSCPETRKEAGLRAREFVLKRHTLKRLVTDIKNLYLEIS